MTPTSARTTAIVVGSGIAGLLTARVLSDLVDEVVVLERDRLTEETDARPFAPQGRHAHALLPADDRLVDGWFPGVGDELLAAGGVAIDSRDSIRFQGGGYGVRGDHGDVATSMTRPLLESIVRRRLLDDRTNVTLLDGTTVESLTVVDQRVTGVVADGETFRADLVVDCSGRSTRSIEQLAAHDIPAPETSSVRIGMAYTTRVFRRQPDDIDGTSAVVCDDPVSSHRMASMLPVEDDRWIVTLAAFHGDVPPTDAVQFERFARSLPSQVIAGVVAAAEPLSGIVSHGLHTTQRRHLERLSMPPPGFVLLGDALCSFDPTDGQTVTSAAMQARALGKAITHAGVRSPLMPGAFYRRAAEILDVPWRISAGGGGTDPRTTGSEPQHTTLTSRYVDLVVRACRTSEVVERQTLRVQNLLDPPQSLVRPAIVLRVLATAGRTSAHRRRTPLDAVPIGGDVRPSGRHRASTGRRRRRRGASYVVSGHVSRRPRGRRHPSGG